ncbi:hypothetical protein [Dendronalium sp. ChiSLP03b]|uniref:hypothetical protein n=1 Tax=Dendronalium sp. ChiSLP03b TaxID=3075381 RepID=UPI002ADB2B32|nr:hypothetical protein [Dendronalium sp. ChiSLP03b]
MGSTDFKNPSPNILTTLIPQAFSKDRPILISCHFLTLGDRNLFPINFEEGSYAEGKGRRGFYPSYLCLS